LYPKVIWRKPKLCALRITFCLLQMRKLELHVQEDY
jgi:hypothetical protein